MATQRQSPSSTVTANRIGSGVLGGLVGEMMSGVRYAALARREAN